jgi:choline dehydrogenase
MDISAAPPPADGPEPGYTITSALMQPVSHGTVRLASGSPDATPVVDPRYLSDLRDVQAMVAGLKIAREIRRATALAPWRAAEALPGPGADTDDALRRYADQTMGSYFHPVGICRIGTDYM